MSLDPRPFTLAEFLAWEARQSAKFEYRDGAIFAMAGATDDHGQIVANLIALIRPKLRGTTSRVYPQDMKVITDFPGSQYPDLVITCDARDAKDKLIKRHPKLIIEVLSRSTVAVDTDDKLDEYETIAELETEPAAVAGSIELRSIGLTISFADIYEDVDSIVLGKREEFITK